MKLDMFIKEKPVVIYNSDSSYTFRHVNDVNLPKTYDAIDRVMKNVDTNLVYPVLLLEGGVDIDPTLYGEDNIESYVSMESVQRDQREIYMHNLAVELGWSVFGICRGHQLLAAINGGSLHQHIYDFAPNHGGGWANITYAPLEDFRSRRMQINSYHHQAIKTMPSNAMLTVSALDGIIEGVVYKDYKAVSYQFHPEFMDDVELLFWSINHMERLNESRSTHGNRDRTTRDQCEVSIVS